MRVAVVTGWSAQRAPGLARYATELTAALRRLEDGPSVTEIRTSHTGPRRVAWSQVVLPVLVLSYGSLAYLSRFTRGVTLEVIRQDYVRTARAKGLDERSVLRRHVFRNMLIPVVTLLALLVPGIISGSIIIEKIFSWPGTGSLFITAALSRDYPTVMGESFLSAAVVLAATLAADIAYAFVDPRIRYR